MVSMFNRYGQIDLSLIQPAEVEALDEPQQIALSLVCEAVKARELAAERYAKLRDAVREAMIVESDALAAHQAANPPPSPLEIHRAAIEAFNKANS